MARCILLLTLCLAFAVQCALSRRISQDRKVASAYVVQQPQDDTEHNSVMSAIFVKGFDCDTNEGAVRKHFAGVGVIMDVRFQSRGIAVITYQEPGAATRAVKELHATVLEGQSCYVGVEIYDRNRKAQGPKGKGRDKGRMKPDIPSSRPPGRTVFVHGFDTQTDGDALTNHFGTVGAIEQHQFLSKSSAIIIYAEESAAQQAVEDLDRSTMNGQSRYVVVKLDELHRGKLSGVCC